MEFIKANYLNTTSQMTVNSNTLASSSLFNRDPAFQYYTDGLNSDLTTSSITITFDATTPVSRISMLDMNFKEFRVFYNGATANSFSIQNGDTTVSSYTGNADPNKYFRFNTVQCSSITIQATKTMVADQEKYIGLFVASDLIQELELRPSAKGYKPRLTPKQIVHKLSDGGTRIHNVKKKWETQLELDFISRTERDNLQVNLFDRGEEFNFCPFGTTTAWDGQIFECIWDGPFTFYEYSDNNNTAGYSGKISLKETPS